MLPPAGQFQPRHYARLQTLIGHPNAQKLQVSTTELLGPPEHTPMRSVLHVLVGGLPKRAEILDGSKSEFDGQESPQDWRGALG
jgi:hypothetical protein